jgi:6-phosphogluconate dehydrogenase (decarboxylating)
MPLMMGKASFFLGEVGAGAKMKLVVNMVMGSMMAAFSEGVSLTEKAELDPEAGGLLRTTTRGGRGESLVPPYTRVSVSCISLSHSEQRLEPCSDHDLQSG